ncbi:MAG: aminotransferase class IV [Deltaproteobacteria bacterium]|nr:aminotransferase class IV [Deltaproteobacteria bacterium]
MPLRINIDGRILPANRARIPVLDRGFLYGDSVYEVLRTYGGRLFAEPQHLRRLEHSAAALAIDLPSRAWLRRQIRRTMAAAREAESYVRVIVTRGVGPLTLDPTSARRPCTVIVAKALESFPAAAYRRGIRVHIPAIRRNAREALDPAVKSGNYLNSVLALGAARRAGCDDALMLDERGRVTEATSANVFAVLRGTLCTPPLDAGILEGVTRGLVLRLAAADGLRCAERHLRPADLLRASEVLLTSTLREVMPVVGIDRGVVADGRPGPVARRLRGLLAAHAGMRPRAAAPGRRKG